MKTITLTQKQKDRYEESLGDAIGWLDEHAPAKLGSDLATIINLIRRIPVKPEKKPVVADFTKEYVPGRPGW